MPSLGACAGPASSGYFIQPAVQDQVGAATFIVLEYPVDPTQERLLYFFGMGIFFRSRQAVAANFPGKWQVGKSIHILFPGTDLESCSQKGTDMAVAYTAQCFLWIDFAGSW